MKTEIWQTTNQQPWVEALACGLITCKTRNSCPTVPVGAIVLLHASKSRLWPRWELLEWTENLDSSKWDRGKIIAVARVQEVGETSDIMQWKESRFWNLHFDNDVFLNCAADFTIRFKDIVRLKAPVEVRGFQAPFVHAKEETVKKVLRNNPELKSYLCHS